MKSNQIEHCKWEKDEWHCYYETSCGNAHQFTAGNIEENNYKYCPFCGKPIFEVKNE